MQVTVKRVEEIQRIPWQIIAAADPLQAANGTGRVFIEDAALNAPHGLRAYSSEALLIVIIRISDVSLHRSQSETDEQHHLSCAHAEQKPFAGPVQDAPELSIVFVAQTMENVPKRPKNARWIKNPGVRTDSLSGLNRDASKVEKQFWSKNMNQIGL